MVDSTQALFQLAVTLFELRPPIYEFALCPGGELASAPAKPKKPFEPDFAPDWLGAAANPSQTDLVEDLARLPFPTGIARTVVCAGALEHVGQPQQAVEEMLRILAPGGLLIVSTPLGALRCEGQDPDFVGQSLHRAFCRLNASVVAWLGPEHRPYAVFGVACKAPVPESFLGGVKAFLNRAEPCLDELSARQGWWQSLWARFWPGTRRASGRGPVRFMLDLPADRLASRPHKTSPFWSHVGSHRNGRSPIIGTDPS